MEDGMTKWKRYVKCSLYSLAICENHSCGLFSYCFLLSLIFFSVYLEKLVFRNLEFLEMFYLSHYWTWAVLFASGAWKEARNEVLSHWIEPGHEWHFRVSVFTLLPWFRFCFLPYSVKAFPTLPPFASFKKVCFSLMAECIKFRKVFLFFLLFVVNFLWCLWLLKSCCIVVWQTNGSQCVRSGFY